MISGVNLHATQNGCAGQGRDLRKRAGEVRRS